MGAEHAPRNPHLAPHPSPPGGGEVSVSRLHQIAALPFLLLSLCASANSWEAQLHATLEHTALPADGVLNPDNALARLPRRAAGLEARLLGRIESDRLRLSLRPILPLRTEDSGAETRQDHQGYLSQWQLRATLPQDLTLSAGREVLHWGPAQFRSPASPFYFDNGRANPARELGGMDAARLAWTPSPAFSASLAWVQESGHEAAPGDPWRRTWLLRAEHRGDDWTAGLAAARPQGRGAFIGGYGQWTPSEAWLLYGEAASSRLADALASSADPAQPFVVESVSPRRGSLLLGAALTFENGHSLTLEALYHGHGYPPAQVSAYFARAAGGPANAALALMYAPPLLGRRYLHAVWQTNPLEQGDYGRVMASHNLDDGSTQWAAYLDHPLDNGLNLYLLAVANQGGPQREFSALTAHSLLAGLRWSLP